ncbi:AraC-like DNA-binding protein [Lewinella marina]|uniref:HTH araC/xylS-type domain-containing protein n=1 Tax=Neolewinella marina TaxID=438751 RepID=A0A2G0CDM6_9BACT|nr:AraC family transcriptional regulator [Neolewinella marina]NJB85950.1 AraC-like DNA-binding protein [Neolewinella marina]PHK98079.1 hypothetical protein CGL56_12880 [Neolewinella marina]
MKLQYKTTDSDPLSSISVRRIQQPYIGQNWHFHEEYELIYFLEGQGMRIVGDHMSNFKAGELVLVGQWLPHLWRNDDLNTGGLSADFIVVKFKSQLKGIDLFALPELSTMKMLLHRSANGMLFSTSCLPAIHPLMLQLAGAGSVDRIVHFLRIMDVLSRQTDYEFLASHDFTLPTEVTKESRLQSVINYIFERYTQEITLDDISDVACLTPPAFCRFFKNRTNKTFFHFLNEFRINKACQLLIGNERQIKEICFDVGFQSLTNFNRIFRKAKGITPSQYRSRYRKMHA